MKPLPAPLIDIAPPFGNPKGFIVVGRSASLSSQIVSDVREALFAKKLKPGDFLGTEKDIAARYGVSRTVPPARLGPPGRLGTARLRMGRGGGGGWPPGIRGCSPRRSRFSSTSPG